jgi:hypothetical protein
MARASMIRDEISVHLGIPVEFVGVLQGENVTLRVLGPSNIDKEALAAHLRAKFTPAYVNLGLIRFV